MTDRKPNVSNEAVLLTFAQVAEMTQLSEGTIRNMIHRGDFPRFRKVSRNASRFLRSEVEQWIEQQFVS